MTTTKKEIEKIHYLDGSHYLCNRACNINLEKTTLLMRRVTCKNCIRELKKQGWKGDKRIR